MVPQSAYGLAASRAAGPLGGLEGISVAAGVDDLAVVSGPQREPRPEGDRVLDERDAAVGLQHIDAAGVPARRRVVVGGLGLVAAVDATVIPRVLAPAVGRHHGIEEGVAHDARSPAIPAIV